ncbi:MAG TPA: CpsD/CapB family tyrosine-protein kinase [Polyangiaceae bacterium]|nr:CpsD/CapB family tyrosine-protein kinase [Polyangiaceae bacterium]
MSTREQNGQRDIQLAHAGTHAVVAGGTRHLSDRPGPDQVSAELLEGLANTTEQLDAFRELRTQLMAMAARMDMSHFTTMVAPVSAASGGGFVARNLAASFTLEESRVAVLIDCNLRDPTQHRAFGVDSEEGGLFDYLDKRQGAVTLRPTALPRLHLIPAGRPDTRPREYFSGRTMRDIMAAFRQSSCFVVLDAPAVKGAPDARILSELADLVVLVAGYGVDTAESVSEAAELFDKKKFAGVVFNEAR